MYLNPITVDSVTYNFTEESLKELIKSETNTKLRLESVRLETQESYRKIVSLRSQVYDFFSEKFDDDSDEATINRDEINEFLESIGSDVLTTTWSATIEITVTVSGIKATSIEEVEDIITDNIEVNGYDLELSDPNVCVSDIERE